MKKKLIILIIVLASTISGIAIYKYLGANNLENKTYEFLRTKGYTSNDIDDIEIKHSFINKILGYNEWRIFVEFEVEDDLIFAFTYRNNEIIKQGIKNEHYNLTKEEIQDYENKFENGFLKTNKSLANNTSKYKPQLVATTTDYKVYEYNLTDETIILNKNTYLLKDYIKENYKERNITKIIDLLELVESYDDGGTKLYRNKDITLIKCNTLEGNKDIYIGNKDMYFKANFCKNDNKTFIKTYLIEDIKEYTEQQYINNIPVTYGNSFQVTLSIFQGEKATVIINNLWDTKLEKGKYYEFEFMFYENINDKEDSIEYIFKNSNIIEVRETKKIGLEQIQESIN